MSRSTAVCRDCGADDWETDHVDTSVSVSIGSNGVASVDVDITCCDVVCGKCGADAEDAVSSFGTFDDDPSDDVLEHLVGARVETTDHVRRAVVAALGGHQWVDEDGVTNHAAQIRAVIHDGQAVEARHYMALMADREIAGAPA